MGVPENVVFIANIAMIVDKPWTTSDSFWMFLGPAFSDNSKKSGRKKTRLWNMVAH